MLDFRDFSKIEPETTDYSECEPELELIDFKDFSEPEPELEVIDLKKNSKHEPKTTDFSDPEPEFEYLSKPKAIENDMSLRICIKKSEIIKKEIGSESNDKVGISLFLTSPILKFSLISKKSLILK